MQRDYKVGRRGEWGRLIITCLCFLVERGSQGGQQHYFLSSHHTPKPFFHGTSLDLSLARLPGKQFRGNARQSMCTRACTCVCVCVLQTELPFSASPSGKWWEERNIGLFFNFALDITSFGVCSKDIPTREKLSRLLNHWIRIEMFSFIMILALFMNQPDNCLSFAHVPRKFMYKGYSIIEN